MKSIQTATPGRVRRLVLATIVAAFCSAALAQTAGAAATLNVSTDADTVNANTSLTINTALSGWFNEKRQYGARVTLPPSLHIDYPAYGGSADRCSAGSFSSISTGLTPGAQAFSNASCPPEAKVGTATLGNASGSIYWVDTSPLPQLGVFFDSGVSTPYGRRLNLTYDGSTPTLQITGLVNASTSGLTLTFNNPSRPNLQPKIWRWTSGGDSDCTPTPTFSGNVWTFPYFGGTATTVNMAAKQLTLKGCGVSFYAVTDTTAAYAHTALTIGTTLTGSGNDVKQYGMRVQLPPSLRIAFPAYGDSAQQCDAGAFSSISTGFTPPAQSFDPSSCPAEAKVGTATLGNYTGSIYWVGISPLPAFGVYFDDGQGNAFGRRLSHSYDGSSPILQIAGLPNAATGGLELSFNNPSRPVLSPKIWQFVGPGQDECQSAYADATAFMFPSTGSAATAIGGLNSWINVTGC